LKKQRFDGLSEFISRRGRVRVVELILGNGWSISQLAAELNISQQAIYLWLAPEKTHPRNSNLDKLLELAIKVDRLGTNKILYEEAALFWSLFMSRFEISPPRYL